MVRSVKVAFIGHAQRLHSIIALVENALLVLRNEKLLFLCVSLIPARSALTVLSRPLVPRDDRPASVSEVVGLSLLRFAGLFRIAGGLETARRLYLLVGVAQVSLVLVGVHGHGVRLGMDGLVPGSSVSRICLLSVDEVRKVVKL